MSISRRSMLAAAGASIASAGALAGSPDHAALEETAASLIQRSLDSNAALMRGNVDEYRALIQLSDDFTRLRLGTTARRAFDVAAQGRRADYLIYGFVDVFPDLPESALNGEDGSGDPQFELGVTLGTTEPVRVLGIALPRVGLGYRFGNGLSAYRLVFGGPF